MVPQPPLTAPMLLGNFTLFHQMLFLIFLLVFLTFNFLGEGSFILTKSCFFSTKLHNLTCALLHWVGQIYHTNFKQFKKLLVNSKEKKNRDYLSKILELCKWTFIINIYLLICNALTLQNNNNKNKIIKIIIRGLKTYLQALYRMT